MKKVCDACTFFQIQKAGLKRYYIAIKSIFLMNSRIPMAFLSVDESDFAKNGADFAEVRRQYCGKISQMKG
jgi:hypothetical protein